MRSAVPRKAVRLAAELVVGTVLVVLDVVICVWVDLRLGAVVGAVIVAIVGFVVSGIHFRIFGFDDTYRLSREEERRAELEALESWREAKRNAEQN